MDPLNRVEGSRWINGGWIRIEWILEIGLWDQDE